MAPDELGGRGDREPLLGRRATIAVAVLVAAVVGLSVAGELTGSDRNGAPEPSRSPQSAATSGPTTLAATWVVNDVVCPVQTDGRELLVVRFILANRSGRAWRSSRSTPSCRWAA